MTRPGRYVLLVEVARVGVPPVDVSRVGVRRRGRLRRSASIAATPDRPAKPVRRAATRYALMTEGYGRLPERTTVIAYVIAG
ncbi:hypothetical protein MAGR_72800 [Mycolicibacterium agri]|uniref:Uncharacterized protein n=1 Tax=Mycolicibacterium agri TaxID=36811 RepID=A0A7I9WEE6_MYCAG|nr:hypothetical protein MAGR_72800 [Mycolicibacterium agri]